MHIKRILCTGCAGFISSHVVKRCIDEGWTVDGIDDLSNGHREFLHAGLNKFFRGDFADEIAQSMIENNKYDCVFHLAATPRVGYSIDHPVETNDNNVTKSLKLMEMCRGKVGRFVFSSSSSVYGGADVLPTPETYPKNPKSPYALQKSIIEDYLDLYAKLYEFDSVCLRYFNVFGPRGLGGSAYCTAVSSWLSAIINDEQLRSDGDGTQTRDMCYVENVAEANVLAAKCPSAFSGDKFNVACGDFVSNNDILSVLKIRFPGIVVMDAPWRAGDVMCTLADVTKAKQVLGYTAPYTFWQGLDKTIEWAMSTPFLRTLRSKF